MGTGGAMAQCVMCRLEKRLNCAILASSGYSIDPADTVQILSSPLLQEAQAEQATLTAESTKEEYVRISLKTSRIMWEVEEGDEWDATLKKGHEDDFDKGWISVGGATPTFSTLAYAGWAKTHEEHKAMLKENKVPCMVLAGRNDPIVPYRQTGMLAANTGNSLLETHEHGHMLGPKESRTQLLDKIAEFVKTRSMTK